MCFGNRSLMYLVPVNNFFSKAINYYFCLKHFFNLNCIFDLISLRSVSNDFSTKSFILIEPDNNAPVLRNLLKM